MTDPDRQAKHNARRRARKLVTNKDVSAEIAVIYEKPIEQWDDEELTRGRPRSSDGSFRGSRPKWLTPTLQAERQRRLRQLMADDLATFAGDALRVVHAVVVDDRCDEDGKPMTPTKVRLDAAMYLLDQFMGKAKVSVDVNEHNPLMELMSAALVNPDGKPAIQMVEVIDQVQDDEDDGPDHTPPSVA